MRGIKLNVRYIRGSNILYQSAKNAITKLLKLDS